MRVLWDLQNETWYHTWHINNGFPGKFTPNLGLEESLVISWVDVGLKGFLTGNDVCNGLETPESVATS